MDSGRLSFALHVLTARMDAAADVILRERCAISYGDFLTLFAVDLLVDPTQRDLAGWLRSSEASLSRQLPSLAASGWLEVRTMPGRGHRRLVVLTPDGLSLVRRGRRLLERRFAEVVGSAGVDYATYAAETAAVLAVLEEA
jgi:DNA-binding MarR family transcriptional regulator